MPKRTRVEREKAIRMLQANVTPSVIAQQFRCHERTIKRLRKRFLQFGTMFMTSSSNDATSSDFVVRSLEGIIDKLVTNKISAF